MKKSKLLNKILDKTIPFLLASAVAYTSYVGRIDGYLQRSLGFFSDKYKQKTAEQVIKDVSSWKEARNYLLSHLTYSSDNKNYGHGFEAPFRTIHKKGRDDCDGGAAAAAALLKDNSKYDVKKMVLYTKSGSLHSLLQNIDLINSHAVALIYDKETKKYGSLGINPCDNIKLKYKSPEDVFSKLNQSFFWSFKNFDCNVYDVNSLVDGMHPIKESLLNHNLENQLNEEKTKLFIAYTPFNLEQDDGDFEKQEFIFVEESDLNKFNYQDVSQWDKLYFKKKKVSNEEFLKSNDGPISCVFYSKKDLTDTKNYSIYSE